MMLYLQLFWEFFQTGLFSIGGGLATLPFLSDIADRLGWFTQATLADMVAVAESTPGPLGIKTAAYAGYVTGGIPGAVLAAFSLILPSIIIILIIARVLQVFKDNKYLNTIFLCLRPASLGLIVVSLISVCEVAFINTTYTDVISMISWKGVVLAAALLVFTQLIPKTKKWHPIIWILISAVIGILFF